MVRMNERIVDDGDNRVLTINKYQWAWEQEQVLYILWLNGETKDMFAHDFNASDIQLKLAANKYSRKQGQRMA